MTSSTITTVLQTYSILAATLAAGTNLATSIVFLPVLLRSPPSSLASQWQFLFNKGITPVVTTALTSSVGFAILAYQSSSIFNTAGFSNTKSNLYIAAAVGTIGLAPYTQILMGGINKELNRRAVEGGEKGTREWVERWGRYNFWRGFMLLCGAVAGILASVD